MTSHWDWDYMSSEEIDKLFLKENNSIMIENYLKKITSLHRHKNY